MTTLDAILNIEENDQATAAEVLESWALLIKTGMVWQLQGFYGRGATNLIENGIISPQGEILATFEEEEEGEESENWIEEQEDYWV